MMASSENQPFALNSTIDPSRCRHLKQKFTGTQFGANGVPGMIGITGNELGLRMQRWYSILSLNTAVDFHAAVYSGPSSGPKMVILVHFGAF